jgi:N-acetylglucosaminyldiphosphoundecaprenol N-acetyl-beta-D-mannosaminyltransferase
MEYNLRDSLDREVYCLLGVPVDAINEAETLSFLANAVRKRRRCFLSTVNLNFLALARRYPEFHRSLLDSDLCTADGVGVTTLARINRVPLQERVTGADLLENFRVHPLLPERRLKLYLFGGQEGVAAAACRKLEEGGASECVGHHFPGFGDIDEMSDRPTIAAINASGADAVIVSLGARKGQAWIMANRHRLEAPVVSHLGAAINFVTGTVKRAPRSIQRLGLEWLWRIRAEPQLWSRYANDAALVGGALVNSGPDRLWLAKPAAPLDIDIAARASGTRMTLAGGCNVASVAQAREAFRDVLAREGAVYLEFASRSVLDCRFLGLVQMFDRELRMQGRNLKIIAEAGAAYKSFRLHGADYLLSKDDHVYELASKNSM